MRLTRIITKDVDSCCECPYYFEERDMSSTLHGCVALGKLYDAIFANRSFEKGIYDQCPYKKHAGNEESKIGKWIDDHEGFTEHYGPLYRCSECGGTSIGKQNFCKDCGADMRGE